MSRLIQVAVFASVIAFTLGRLTAQEIEPSCLLCAADHVPAAELERYEDIAIATGAIDQQVRSIDIGRSNVQVALARRNALPERRGRVAEHDLVTEVYVVLSGGGTILTGAELIDAQRRPADNPAVMRLNGPGQNAADVADPAIHELAVGDVFVIPAGTGHEFTHIDDHITYLMVRVDPDKVVPLMNAEDSARYLEDRESAL